MISPMDECNGTGVDPFIDAYEAAQARDGHAALADYLPAPNDPLYPVVLCELVRVDLEYRWMRGRPRPLEDYLAEFPTLTRNPDLLRKAAFEECRLRRQAGETPAPDEYLRRFGINDLGWLLPRPASVGQESETALRAARHSAGANSADRDEATQFAESLALASDPHAHAESIRTLREADPRTADRVAAALKMLPEPGSDFAGFRLIRELGSGAFGRVYLARQGDLADRFVALKVSADLFDEPRALAQLQHTHIVPIYSTHQVGPLRAICMPYFGATTLVDVLHDLRGRDKPPESGAALVEFLMSRRISQAPDTVEPPASTTATLETLRRLSHVQAVLWMGARLTDGLAHAHERGIVHRDLKPANVLLTDEGQPMLLDFNLAADTKQDGAAAAAMIGGTLPYMAPESLEALRVGPQPANGQGDLYALGLILYELLTGRHPFPIRRGPLSAILPLMIEDRLGPPPRPRSVNPAVSPATESILLRCLDPNPARRYQDARQLLDDLHRQLEDRPLRHAPEPSPRERMRKWTRRHPRLSSGTALAAVAVLLIAVLVAGYNHRQRRFGPVEAALVFRQLADEHETARVLLLDPADDPARRDEGVAACRRALERYTVVDNPSWQGAPLVRNLPAARQAELRVHAGELLMLWAKALARQATGQGSARRVELARSALRRNALAESCYALEEVPRVLFVQRASLARLAGESAEAERAHQRAIATPVRSLRDYALLFIDDPDHALSAGTLPALAEASRRNPQDFALWMNLGQCHALQGRLGEAEDCFTIAIVLRPQSPWAYFHRGRVELDQKAYAQARLDFDQVLRLHPGLVPASINRALARMGEKDNAGAIDDLTAALAQGALETRIYFIRAEARLRAGDRAGTERDRAEGLRRTPVDAESWVARGLARLPADPRAALADFEEALKLDPRMRSALQDKAVVYSERLGRAEEAIPILDRVVDLYPDYAPARVGRGVLLARLGRRREAHRDAEDARGRDSSCDTTYRAACIYALTSKADPADRPRALRILATVLSQEASWIETARADPDLDAIRDQNEFRDLLNAFSERAGPGE